MRLGIDFGTTRTVVTVADRGNYPIVGFEAPGGDVQLWHPSLVAARGAERRYGLEAQGLAYADGWFLLRSIKRRLAEAGPGTLVELGDAGKPLLDILIGYLQQLRRDLVERSNLDIDTDERLEAMIGVPANANSNQRFLTLEAFRRAGFEVAGMLNEPSAAGIEYSHRYGSRGRSGRRQHLLVYDLGGGTFDVSIISMRGRAYKVLGNEGIARLGGDDFDQVLLDLVAERAGAVDGLTPGRRALLLEECREQKEGLHPNTRKIVVDLGRCLEGAAEIVIETSEFYDRCRLLVERTVDLVETAVAACKETTGIGWDQIAAVYLVGGSSDLPVVSRRLRERYAHRARRSPYPYASTAIGLAVALEAAAELRLQDRFGRYFGVWRESDEGRQIVFDPIFPKGTPLPGPGEPPLVYTRTYSPVHTVGHYRFLECSQIGVEGQPGGDVTPWDEIYFPLDPRLREEPRLETATVARHAELEQQRVRERYSCDRNGMIEVTISNQTAGYERTYRLRR